jgi:hypothetical protein
MKTRIGLIVAVLLIAWLSAALVRVENERYALQLGMCWNEQLKLPDITCIQKAHTRVSWYGHLFYALNN